MWLSQLLGKGDTAGLRATPHHCLQGSQETPGATGVGSTLHEKVSTLHLVEEYEFWNLSLSNPHMAHRGTAVAKCSFSATGGTSAGNWD